MLFRPVVTNCSHRFCSKCLMESLLISEKCPLCRAKITKKTEDKELQSVIEKEISELDFSRREKEFQMLQKMMRSIVYV